MSHRQLMSSHLVRYPERTSEPVSLEPEVVPNAETRKAMAEVDEMVRQGRAQFANVDELFAELEEASGR